MGIQLDSPGNFTKFQGGGDRDLVVKNIQKRFIRWRSENLKRKGTYHWRGWGYHCFSALIIENLSFDQSK
jgi:hypothetical protein